MEERARFITNLVVHYLGRSPATTEVASPSWNDIEAAIQALDGLSQDQVVLVLDQPNHMTIGGGEAGIFVCDAQVVKGQYILTDPSRSDSETVSYMCGQPGESTLRYTADLETVLAAARWFFEYGDIRETLSWERV